MTPTPRHKLLIASRGEVAIRIARAAQALGWRSVAVASPWARQAIPDGTVFSRVAADVLLPPTLLAAMTRCRCTAAAPTKRWTCPAPAHGPTSTSMPSSPLRCPPAAPPCTRATVS